MQCHPPALGIFRTGSFRETLHGNGAAGRTNQRLLVPVCRDQYERLWRSVLLHAPTSHSRPFQGGWVARNWLTPPTRMYEKSRRSAKRRVTHMTQEK